MADYDQSLLKDTKVSKAARQEGYNVDLLNDRSMEAPLTGSRTPEGRTSTRQLTDPEIGQAPSTTKEYDPVIATSSTPVGRRKVPFWRTKKGIIILSVVAVVIVAAIVGGVVGGVLGNRKSSSPNSGPGAGSGSGNGTESGSGNSNGAGTGQSSGSGSGSSGSGNGTGTGHSDSTNMHLGFGSNKGS